MPRSDTLSIDSLRLQRDIPMAQTQEQLAAARPADPENHPQAAAAARAKIAALPELTPLAQVNRAPATPTAELITDRTVLVAGTGDPVARRPLPSVVQPILTAAGIFLLTLLVFKAPVIISQIEYLFHKPTTPAVSATNAAATAPAGNTISIPKINVQAPVIYEQSTSETDVETALENGVVHYGNTALPGQNGNVAIFGHSSNDWWQPGNYKFVFVLLDKLSPGDLVTVNYNSKAYTYQVTGSQIVDPNDVAVLEPTTTPTLTIITCSPPGTSLRRLVVTAKQISPDPNGATAGTAGSTSSNSGGTLPSAPSGFLTQLHQAWDGIISGIGSLFGASPSTSPSPSPANGTGAATLPAAN